MDPNGSTRTASSISTQRVVGNIVYRVTMHEGGAVEYLVTDMDGNTLYERTYLDDTLMEHMERLAGDYKLGEVE